MDQHTRTEKKIEQGFLKDLLSTYRLKFWLFQVNHNRKAKYILWEKGDV